MSANISQTIQETAMIIEGILGFRTKAIDKPPIDTIEKNSHYSWINKNFKATHDVCHHIFTSNPNFFNIISEDKLHTDFASLDSNPSFWSFITKQQAIISSYAKIRKLAAANNIHNDYNFVKLLSPCKIHDTDIQININKYGLNYLVDNEYNSVENKLSSINSVDVLSDKAIYSKIAWDRNKNISAKAKSLFQALDDLFDLTCIEPYDTNIYATKPHQQNKLLSLSDEELKNAISEIETDNQYVKLLQLNTLELYQIIIGRNESGKYKNINNIISAHRNPDAIPKGYKSDCKTLLAYIQIPGYQYSEENSINTNFSLADKIYARHLTERIFGITTINHINDLLYNSPHSDILQREARRLAMIFLLPNTFSRDLILQMAVDTINYNYYEKIYNNPFDKHSASIKVKELSTTQNTFQKDILWSERFSDMVNILQKYAFPVYENHYFLQLWNNTRPYCNSDSECIDTLFNLLSNYLNDKENVEELMSLSKFASNSRPNRDDGIQFSGKYSLTLNKFENDIFDCNPSSNCLKLFKLSNGIESEISDFMKVTHLEYLQPGISKQLQLQLYNGAALSELGNS